MAHGLFWSRLAFIKPQKMLSLHPGFDVLALGIIFTLRKSYSCPINYPVFYQPIGRGAISAKPGQNRQELF